MSHVLRLKKSVSVLFQFRKPMTVGAFNIYNTKALSACVSCGILRSTSVGKLPHVVTRTYSSESANLKRLFVPSRKRKWKKKKSAHSDEIKSTLIQVIDARAKQLACKIIKANTDDILLQLIPSSRNVSNNAFLVLPTSAKSFLETSSSNTIAKPNVSEGQGVHNVEQNKTNDLSKPYTFEGHESNSVEQITTNNLSKPYTFEGHESNSVEQITTNDLSKPYSFEDHESNSVEQVTTNDLSKPNSFEGLESNSVEQITTNNLSKPYTFEGHESNSVEQITTNDLSKPYSFEDHESNSVEQVTTNDLSKPYTFEDFLGEQFRPANVAFVKRSDNEFRDQQDSWSNNLNSFRNQFKDLPVASESRTAKQLNKETDGKVSTSDDLLPASDKLQDLKDDLSQDKGQAKVSEDVSSTAESVSLGENNSVAVSHKGQMGRSSKTDFLVKDHDGNKPDSKINKVKDKPSGKTNIPKKKPSLVKGQTIHSKEKASRLGKGAAEICDTDPSHKPHKVSLDSSAAVADGSVDGASTKSVTETKPNKAKTKPKGKKVGKDAKAEAEAPVVKQPFKGNPQKQNRHFNQDLLSFVQTCCFSNKQSHAHSVLKIHHLNKTPIPEKIINDITIHNTLMQSWAKLGKLHLIKELFSMLQQAGMRPSLQSYAACLDCLGRQNDLDVEMCQRVLQDITRDGFDVKDIFNVCTFKRDEQHFVLRALKLAIPGFVPHPIPDPEPYKGDLLEELNSKLPPEQVVERNPYAGIVTTSDLQKRAELQLQMELKGCVTVESIVKSSTSSPKTTEYRDILDGVKDEWRGMLVKSFERMVHNVTRKSKDSHTQTLYPYLTLLPPLDMVDCIMQEMEQISLASDSFSICMDQLCRRVGMRVYNRYDTQDKVRSKYVKKVSRLYEKYVSHYNDEEFPFTNHRECWQHLMKQSPEGASLDVIRSPWSPHIVKALGRKLYDIILNDVRIDSNMLKKKEKRRMVPAFYTIYRNYGHRTYQEIKPHPVIVKLFHIADISQLTFDTTDLPMIVPPVPWISKNYGGLLLGSAQLIRLPAQAQSQTDQLDKTPPSQIYSVLDSLTTLSVCAWNINKPMLDLIIHIFNNKGMKELDIPPPITECPPMPKITQNMTAQEKSKVFRERLRLRQHKSEMYSLWCQELYRLSIANKFRDEVFWFPHNLDFRGRTYPYPPHFNHLGSDVARSILVFAKGKPLGEKGLDWLKIHLINLTGFKKRSSNADRLKYANEMMEDILDSADNPMEGRKWWQTSDEPWQTLACCKEITNAVRSPDVEQYVSHYPVHQDGSCNGLQHYAALGRDQSGAESVNLHPFSSPQDVYSDIAELVEAIRAQDEKDGVEIAAVLKGFVRRKVIKQTVMTTVYGVTKYGAKLQILRQLKDIPEYPQRHAWAGSIYLTEKTFQCLMEMFSATKDIQDWLTSSAHLISTVCRKPVEWVTPLGLPVIQPYHRAVHFNKYGIQLFDAWSQFEKPNSMKQKNAFPPNFIHSLDSTHMMLTSLYCLQAGITFVSVHDCYWTHASDVPVMNRICREQFVSLHSQPILEYLSKFLVDKFGSDVTGEVQGTVDQEEKRVLLNSVLRKVPEKGSFNLKNVLNSTYFFS